MEDTVQKMIKLFVLLFFSFLTIGCDQERLEQAYVEGYRVGWSHGIHGHIAQLGNNKNMHYVGVGKECLYEDKEFITKQLKIFKDDRCGE